MSIIIAFYKLVLYSERTVDFPRENIHKSLKALFRGSDHVVNEMIDEYFEEVKLDCIEISYEQFVKVDKKFKNRVKLIFSKEQSSFFFIDEKDWIIVQQLVNNNVKHLFNNNDLSNLDERLKKASMIFSDYKQLENLYKKKLLLAEFS